MANSSSETAALVQRLRENCWKRQPGEAGENCGFCDQCQAADALTPQTPCPDAAEVGPRGHVWSNQYGDDWYPEEGRPCDCGKRLSMGRNLPSAPNPNATPRTQEPPDSHRLITAAQMADWQQVVLNGGPPCFHLEWNRKQFCLRAERWAGHGADGDHPFVSLADLLDALAADRQRLTEASQALDEVVAPDPTKPLAQRIRDEFADFKMLLDHCTHIYDHVTHGRISKPTTLPSVVCGVADDLYTEQFNEELADETKELTAQLAALTAERDALANQLVEAAAKMAFIAGTDNPDTIEAARLVLVQRAEKAEAELDALTAERDAMQQAVVQSAREIRRLEKKCAELSALTAEGVRLRLREHVDEQAKLW